MLVALGPPELQVLDRMNEQGPIQVEPVQGVPQESGVDPCACLPDSVALNGQSE